MTYTLNRKNTIFYYISIALIAVILVVFYYNSIKMKTTEKTVAHTQIVIDKNNEILLDVINIETGARGFILTNNETFLKPYNESQKKINQNLELLLTLTKENPNQQIRVKQLKESILKRIGISKSLINNNNNNNKEVELASLIKGNALMDSIRQNIKIINLEELSLLKQQKSVNVFSVEMSKYLLYALFSLLLVLVSFIYYLFKNHRKQKSELELFNKHQTDASQYSRSLIEASLDPLVTINAEGKITDVNNASIKATGVDREMLIGTDFSNYFTEPKKAQEGYRQVFENGYVENYPLTIKHIDGKLTAVLYNASVYKDDNDNVLGVFAAARDVTSQKQIEDKLLKTQERLNAGLKIANIALSEINYITNTVHLSPESAAMYGFPKNQLEVTRQQMHDTFHPAIKAELEAQIISAMNPDSVGYLALEHPIVLPSGEVRWLKVNKQFFYDHSTQPAKPVYSILVSQDITERKESSQYARSLIEASLDPLVTISGDGKITDVNEASIKVTGVEREKLIGTDFSNYFTEPQKAQEGYQQVFEKGFVADYPLTIKHKNGNLTDVLYNASVYKDNIGNVLGVFAAARDITEQNKQKLKSDIATKNLEDSNDSLKLASQYSRSLIEASLDPLVTISAEGKITDVNNASIKVTGVAREKLVGTDFSNYFTDPKKAQEGYRQVFENGYVEDYPLTIKHINGNLTDVLYNASVYKDDKDKVLGVFAAARDITEQNKQKLKSDIATKNLEDSNDSLKLASQYSLSLIEASRDPLFTISLDGKITDTNQASVRVTDVSKENLIGSHFITYFTEPEKAKSGYEEVFSKGFVVDYPLTIKDGKLTPVLFNGSVYKDTNNNVIGAVVVARDITEQKKAEKELIEARMFAEETTTIAEEAKTIAETATSKAEEAVKSKQQFLSNMSHEIRTPMNAIIGFTKVILKTELTAKQKEYLTAIKMSGDALIVLINDILDLAKVDAGKMTFEKTPFKLSLSIKAMLHLFETKIQEKNLTLITLYDKKIPEVLLGDPVRLHQIILNLVSNAVKFTNEGQITVSVSLTSENDTEVTIKFEVADTGIGIKEKKAEKIFENFQQATSGTSRLFGGTGLGLAIVKQLVEAQNGTIDVVSEFGKGSTFSFSLNFKKTSANAVLEPEIVALNTDIKDTKILVVEDMELNQLLMKTILDDFGFECEIAANGKIAIEKLKNQDLKKPYDIILMDLQMPEMNGFEATEYIRKKLNSSIPIIALTADVTTVDVDKCKAVGMNDYISKPVDERLLYSKLVGLIKKPVLIIERHIEGKKETSTIKYLDMTYLNRLTKSNPVLMTQLINSYLRQTPTLIKTMKQSFHNKDWKLLSATIHKILPSFNIMGMSADVTEIAEKIQEYAHTIEHSKELEGLVLELENVCLQTFKELEIELINLK